MVWWEEWGLAALTEIGFHLPALSHASFGRSGLQNFTKNRTGPWEETTSVLRGNGSRAGGGVLLT